MVQYSLTIEYQSKIQNIHDTPLRLKEDKQEGRPKHELLNPTQIMNKIIMEFSGKRDLGGRDGQRKECRIRYGERQKKDLEGKEKEQKYPPPGDKCVILRDKTHVHVK